MAISMSPDLAINPQGEKGVAPWKFQEKIAAMKPGFSLIFRSISKKSRGNGFSTETNETRHCLNMVTLW
jgi:hypothetical protein